MTLCGCGGSPAHPGPAELAEVADRACARVAHEVSATEAVDDPGDALGLASRVQPIAASTAQALGRAAPHRERAAAVRLARALARDLEAAPATGSLPPGEGTRAVDTLERHLREWRELAWMRLRARRCRPVVVDKLEALRRTAYLDTLDDVYADLDEFFEELGPNRSYYVRLMLQRLRTAYVPLGVRAEHRGLIAAVRVLHLSSRQLERAHLPFRGALGPVAVRIYAAKQRLNRSLDEQGPRGPGIGEPA